MSDDLLGIISKTASIITGVVAVYFGVKDRARTTRLRIGKGTSEIDLISDNAGAFIKRPVIGVTGQFVNKGTRPLEIDKIAVEVEGNSLECFPHRFFTYNYQNYVPSREHLQLDPDRKRELFFYGNEILEKSGRVDGLKKISLRVVIYLENGKRFKSNRLRLNPIELRTELSD